MTLHLKIRSAVYCPAPKHASRSLGGWSILWSCSLGIARGFHSLVMVSLVICSTPLATYSVPRSSDIELLVLSLFVPPLYLSVQRGCRPFQATLPVFNAASTSPSVPADCPHFHWKTGWFVVWSRRCRVHCCTCHHSSMPTSPHQQSILVRDQLTIFIIDGSFFC